MILGLVGRDGAGPHDIVRMMREGEIFWKTSESHYYAEPKRLANLGYLTATKSPGRTRERTHYALTERGREALAAWLAAPAAMPRIQNEAAVKLLAADLVDDETVLKSLAALRVEIEAARERAFAMRPRAEAIPHRTRYLNLLSDLALRTLEAQSEWLDHVERELGGTGG